MTFGSEMVREPPLWRQQEPPQNRSLYFSLYPADDIAVEAHRLAAGLRQAHGLNGRPVPAERLHISLNGLGAFPVLCQRTAERALYAVRAVRMPRFRIALNRAETWGKGAGKRPLVLVGDDGLEGVRILRSRIQAALADLGLARRGEHGFEPHMTLLRDPRQIPSTAIPPLAWTAQAFALVYSFKDEGRHQVLSWIPLGP